MLKESSTGVDEDMLLTFFDQAEIMQNVMDCLSHEKQSNQYAGSSPKVMTPMNFSATNSAGHQTSMQVHQNINHVVDFEKPAIGVHIQGFSKKTFSQKKSSMMTKRNLLMKLDNDFQQQSNTKARPVLKKMNVDLCLGQNHTPKQ